MDGVGMNECRQLWHGEFAVGRCELKGQARVVLRGAILGRVARLASQPQFYEMLVSSSFIRCYTRASRASRNPAAALRDARLEQFYEAPCSDGGALLQAKREVRKLLLTVWVGAGNRGRGSEAGRVQVVANGLDGCAGRAQSS